MSEAQSAAAAQERRFSGIESTAVAAAVDQERRFNRIEAKIDKFIALNAVESAASAERQQTILARVQQINGSVAAALRWQGEHLVAHAALPDFEEIEGNVAVLMAKGHDGAVVSGVWKGQLKAALAGIGAGGTSVAILTGVLKILKVI